MANIEVVSALNPDSLGIAPGGDQVDRAIRPPLSFRMGTGAMRLNSDQARWKALERNAHQPGVQALIRREIRKGTIRVVPDLKGGIRIIPISPEMKTPPPHGNPNAAPPTRSSRSADARPFPGSARLGPGSIEPHSPPLRAFV